MLFSGVARDTPEADPGHAPVMSTPVIRWGNSKACVFDDRVHHEQAWLVVYGDGQRLTGADLCKGSGISLISRRRPVALHCV